LHAAIVQLWQRPAWHRDEILPGTGSLLCLKTLARSGEMHRHEIASFVPRISTDVFEVEEGSLDPALQRMLINRWVTAGNRRAGYCQPTAEGTKTMAVERPQFARVIGAITRGREAG